MIERRGIILDLDDLHEGWPDLLERSGINVLGIHNWIPDNRFDEKIDALIAHARSAEGGRVLESLRQRGIDVEYELHAMSWLLPREWFRRYPAWFRMDENGERTPADNMCPSNEEAMEVVRLNSAKLVRMLPSTTNRYYLWQDDNKPWCLCDRCRQYSASDQTLLVMNAILEAIRSVHADAKLAYLAYAFTLDTPPEKVKPAEGIFLEMAGPIIHRTPEQREHGMAMHDDERFKQALERNLGVFGSQDAQVLDYWLDASLFSGWRKPAEMLAFDATAAAGDIAFYREKGFRSITTFGVFLDRGYFERYGEPPVADYAALLK
ncbi:DUF4838 domain-containing protein [Paenibacillus sp. GCM10027626]|uniref:DUF4838 domain-containing protein n=1 Tax=Paenibacillus sp. GCM10027626 TaxID=3273411 RepID=UPI00363E7946